jgi:hypothetical protein
VAIVPGQPTVIKNGVKVNPVLDVENVDLSTGNLSFEGTVRVSGDVLTGMKMNVGGDVVINGTVEAAEIVAGGSVTVKGGVIGHSEGVTAQAGTTAIASRISSQKSVQVMFAECPHRSGRGHPGAGQCPSLRTAGRQRDHRRQGQSTYRPHHRRPRGSHQRDPRQRDRCFHHHAYAQQVGLDPYLEEKIAIKEQEYTRKVAELDRTIKQQSYYKLNPEKATPELLHETSDKRKALAYESRCCWKK